MTPTTENELALQIKKLQDRTMRMSYSKLKHLTSPVNFMKNLLKPKEANAGMAFGSLVDLLITEEHSFHKKYAVTSIKISEGNQEEVVRLALNDATTDSVEEKFARAFSAVYKRGKPSDYTHVLEYIKLISAGYSVVSEEEYSLAKQIAENLKNQPEIEDALATAVGFQQQIDFEYAGWNFRGILDVLGTNTFHDLKFVSRLNPDKFSREIDEYGYDLQMAIYYRGLQAAGMEAAPYFITYDKQFNCSVLRFGEDYLSYSLRKLDHYLQRLEHTIKMNAWHRSYDFFEPERVIRKPAYIKGFNDAIFL